jgi:hypothetical protein
MSVKFFSLNIGERRRRKASTCITTIKGADSEAFAEFRLPRNLPSQGAEEPHPEGKVDRFFTSLIIKILRFNPLYCDLDLL